MEINSLIATTTKLQSRQAMALRRRSGRGQLRQGQGGPPRRHIGAGGGENNQEATPAQDYQWGAECQGRATIIETITPQECHSFDRFPL